MFWCFPVKLFSNLTFFQFHYFWIFTIYFTILSFQWSGFFSDYQGEHHSKSLWYIKHILSIDSFIKSQVKVLIDEKRRNSLYSAQIPPFSSWWDKVWHTLLPNILFNKMEIFWSEKKSSSLTIEEEIFYDILAIIIYNFLNNVLPLLYSNKWKEDGLQSLFFFNISNDHKNFLRLQVKF